MTKLQVTQNCREVTVVGPNKIHGYYYQQLPKYSGVQISIADKNRHIMVLFTLRNEGSLAALKEPRWLFCETRGSFDGAGFF